MPDIKPQKFLQQLFTTAVSAVSAEQCVPPNLAPPPAGKTIVVGAGKAAAAMARSVEHHWPGPVHGAVVTRYGHGVACDQIEVIEAAHPVSDQTAVDAANKIVALVSSLTPDDLVIALISGGGSALLSLPAPGVTLAQKQDISRQLLRSGAPINAFNCVRKHLSAIKGGRLAAHCIPAQVRGLLISDIPDNDMAAIASGPTVPDPTTSRDALDVLREFHISVPRRVHEFLTSPRSESPKPGDPLFAKVSNRIIASASEALHAASAAAAARGVSPVDLGHDLEGEARALGASHGRRALEMMPTGGEPLVLLSGGETTVTVRGDGRGGRNVEYLLGLAIALDGAPGVYALAADTDGIDGTEDNAGAVIGPETLSRAARRGLDARGYLDNNDAYSYFAALGDLVTTGPTLTNVNDFRAIYLNRSGA